jgi:hypothetical protein
VSEQYGSLQVGDGREGLGVSCERKTSSSAGSRRKLSGVLRSSFTENLTESKSRPSGYVTKVGASSARARFNSLRSSALREWWSRWRVSRAIARHGRRGCEIVISYSPAFCGWLFCVWSFFGWSFFGSSFCGSSRAVDPAFAVMVSFTGEPSLRLTLSPLSSVRVFSMRTSRYSGSADSTLIWAFSGVPGSSGGMILSTVPRSVTVGYSDIYQSPRIS